MYMAALSIVSKLEATLVSVSSCHLVVRVFCDPIDCSPWILCPWNFPGKNTGVGCHFLLQGIFLTQRWNTRVLHWQADSLPLNHQGSPCQQEKPVNREFPGGPKVRTPCSHCQGLGFNLWLENWGPTSLVASLKNKIKRIE